MAEFDQSLFTAFDGLGGTFTLIAVCEDTQTELDAEGDPSPLVVRVRVVNSTTQPGVGTWMRANGGEDHFVILPGENMETNISPPRRLPLYQFGFRASWGGST